MTSAKFNARRAEAEEEMDLFDRLPSAIQLAMRASPVSVKSKTVWNALVRGVPQAKIIETIDAAAKKGIITP